MMTIGPNLSDKTYQMFKKSIEVKPRSNLKSSEKRKFEQTVGVQIKELAFPPKLSKALFSSTGIKKGTAYFDSTSGDPLFFQEKDDKRIFPTLQELWASITVENGEEHLGIPVIKTHDLVIERLLNGANLMIKGCIGPFGTGLKNGSVVAVVNYTRPSVAIAVGECMMDLEGKDDDDVPDHGVAVQIWTVMGDKLSLLGRKMDEILELNEKAMEGALQTHEEDNKQQPVEGEGADETGKEEEKAGLPEAQANEEEEIPVQKHMDNLDISGGHGDRFCDDGSTGGEGDYEGESGGESENIEEAYVMTTADIDDMFRRSVLYTISQETLEFPIMATNFMSEHVLKNLPPVDTDIVNIKKTSWKKTSKFLKAMEKETLIKLKGKDDSLSVVSSAPRSDPRISGFVPYRIKPPQNRELVQSNSLAAVPLLDIRIYLKPGNALRMMFNRLDEKYDAYYTEPEIKALAQRYITNNPSIVSKKNKQMIEPNEVLAELKINRPIKRAEFLSGVISSCSRYYTISQQGDAESDDILKRKRLTPKKGNIPTIDIVIESVKVGRKVATRVSGCERFFVDMEKLASILKVKCSGSCTITEDKDPKNGKILSVQGKHDAAVVDVLYRDWGIPSRACLVTNKTKGKARRK